MKPAATFLFEKLPSASTRYKLKEHRGEDIPGFPAVWVRGPEKGNEYVGFRATVNHKPGHRHFSHTIEVAKNKTVTGLNFAPEHPRRAFGDFGEYGLLIEFSETGDHLTVLFFEGMKEAAPSLFQLWVSGEIEETPAADSVPLAG
jgi:hypothetical protein